MSANSPKQVPILNLSEQYKQCGAELEKSVLDVLRSGNYILGKYVAELENKVAALCNVKHGIGVANGTDALILALWAIDIKPGDEVITPSFTFAATAEAIALRGAKPVFVDIDANTYNVSPAAIEAAITPKTRAILVVHLYGLPADMDPILAIAKRHNLKVIEDNAQAIGATYKGRPTGSFGDLACTSFYPTKNLGAAGDAGMIVTNNDALATRLKALRAHGMTKRYYHDELGVNSRLDELQAAVLLTKLPYLTKWNIRRAQIAEQYNKAFKHLPNIKAPQTPSEYTHVYHQYTIRVVGKNLRETVIKELGEQGVGSMCYYPVPLHLQAAFAEYGYKAGTFPISEEFSDEVLSIPMYPELTDEQVQYVAAVLTQIAQKYSTATAVGSAALTTNK